MLRHLRMITLLLLLFVVLLGSLPTSVYGDTTNKIYIPMLKTSGGLNPYSNWLSYVNYQRSLAGITPVAEDLTWSNGSWQHAKYVVKNDYIGHVQDLANPWYTPEGALAGMSGNVTGHYRVDASDIWAIDSWMQAPFHAVGILDPALRRVGYGSYREADGDIQMGATIDIIRGLGTIPAEVTYPVMWPGNGTTISLRSHTGEYPSPLTSCPGYATPSGLPIILQLGNGSLTPVVTAHSLTLGATPIEHCVFDETSYVYTDSEGQRLGRNILDSRDAVVIIPKSPLTPGATYTISITVNGVTHAWSFAVEANAE